MHAASATTAPDGAALPLRDAVAQLRTAAADAERWSPARRLALLDAVDQGIAALTTVRGDLLLVERRSSAWKSTGDPSFEAWRGRTSRTGVREAGAEVRRAEALGEIPAMRAAVEDGALTLAHVDVVARTAATGSETVRQALASPEGQTELLALARRTDAGHFAKVAARWSATVDQAALERSHQARRAARFVNLTDTPTGTRLSALLDPMAGHRLRLALEAVSGKPAPDDTRTREQRWADSLDAMASATLATPPTSDGATGRRPHVSIVMTPETWGALRQAARAPRTVRADEAPSPPAAPVPDGAPASLEDGAPVPASELARVLCDCELTRVVLGARTEVLDLGRTVRPFTPGQRRAITARDRGCLWPGCGALPRWCEVHHLVWWDRDGGTTAVLDGGLACSFHHHEIHRLDLVVTRVDMPPGTAPDGRTAAYVITTPGGRLVADGRGRAPDGARVGVPVRTWKPGSGASTGAPERVLTGLAGLAERADPPPGNGLTPDGASPPPPMSVAADTLLSWRSS